MGPARGRRDEGRSLTQLTLVLSESQVESLLDMKQVVAAVEEAFRREGTDEAENVMRTRSRAPGSVLNVMHANLPYLRRGGLKAYMSSRSGTRFVLVLFDSSDSTPLAVMGADIIGRFRTGAASGVATKHLFGRPSGTLAVFGSGKQALTQVLAVGAVMDLEEVRVWSPTPGHREAFAAKLSAEGFRARACETVEKAAEGAQVASAITRSEEPFLSDGPVRSLLHVNACGGNVPGHSELTPAAVAMFGTVVVDDIPQAKVEYGELIQAAAAGVFSWDSAVRLCDVVAGGRRPFGRTLFKSGGAALEDVAVADLVYEKALASGAAYRSVELG